MKPDETSAAFAVRRVPPNTEQVSWGSASHQALVFSRQRRWSAVADPVGHFDPYTGLRLVRSSE